MILFKIMAYIMIVLGAVFTALALVVIIKIDEWFELVLGLLFLGPLSLAVGILVLKKINSFANLETLRKITKK